MRGRIDAAVILAPVVFLLHVAEEAPGFVDWFNSLVSRGISHSLFLSVNAAGFIITIMLTALLALTRERGAAMIMLAWLGFLMLANAILHLTATAVYQRYSPGVVTATILYLPYFAWFFLAATRDFKVRISEAVVSSVVGSVPMAIHGYLIIFRGDRLF